MADEKKTEEQLFYLPPPQLTKWESFKLFLWNSERREFLGRTAASWGKVGLFYLCFYAGLAAFFAVLLVIFYQTLDNFEPKWQLDRSIIGKNPGLGYRPMPPDENIESTLIWFRRGASGNWIYWVESMNVFLSPYEDGRQDGEHFMDCKAAGNKGEEGKVCKVDIKDYTGECVMNRNFGFNLGQPCIAIKLNRIFGWEPDPYVDGDDLPNEISHLKTDISNRSDTDRPVWITCEGENPADKENIGKLTYYPSQGIPYYYFPFRNTPGYLSPFVMVYFGEVKHGVLINIECRAWAKNVEHSRMERKGSVHFELLVD